MEDILFKLKEYAVSTGFKLLGALAILIVGFFIVSRLTKLIKRSKGMQRVDAGAASFITSFISIVLKVIIVLTALGILGVPMTNMVAVLGSCGLTLGLALQGSLTNFAGGLMMLVFKPFKVNDYIETPSSSGTVTKITVLYTYLLTFDNCTIVIPNGALSNAVVKNYTSEPTRRVDLTIGISYSTDIDSAKHALLNLALQHELVLNDPAPIVVVDSYGDSSINLTLRAWTLTENYWVVRNAVAERIKGKFDSCGIEIPFPQVDVHITK